MKKDLDKPGKIVALRLLKRAVCVLCTVLLFTGELFSQQGIGTNSPDPSAALDVYSTDKGFLPPRMTEAQMQAIASPVEGLMVFCTDCDPSGSYLYTGEGFFSLSWDYPLTLDTLDSANVFTNASFKQGITVANVTVTVPYTGSNGGSFESFSVSSTGVTGLVANLAEGSLPEGNGNLTLTINGTPNGFGTTSFEFSIGGQTCNLEFLIEENPASLDDLLCSNVILNGDIITETTISNTTLIVPYSGGNGGFYNDIVLNSTGVTGVVASASAGYVAEGDGNLELTLSGIPSNFGSLQFELTLGSQTCTLDVLTNKISFNGLIYGIVVGRDGKIWLDRNLGATRVANSTYDEEAFGYLYQWGRANDGHQFINSSERTGPVKAGQEGSDFIISSTGSWMTKNENRWNSEDKEEDDPCPPHFRIPRTYQLRDAANGGMTLSINNAFDGPLKLPVPYRREQAGIVRDDQEGFYWSYHSPSPISENDSYVFRIADSGLYYEKQLLTMGFPIRCIRD